MSFLYLKVLSASTALLNEDFSSSTASAALRGSLLSFLSVAVGLQDTTSDTVLQQASLLAKLTSRPDELETSGSSNSAYNLMETVAASGESTGVDQETAHVLGTSISSLLTTVDPDKGSEQLSTSIDSIIRGTLTALAPNEGSVEVSTDNFNMSNAKHYTWSLTNSSLAAPGVNSSVSLPPNGIAGLCPGSGATDAVGLGMASMSDVHKSSKSDENSVNSNLLRFSLTGSSSCAASVRRRLASRSPDNYMTISLETKAANVEGVCSIITMG